MSKRETQKDLQKKGASVWEFLILDEVDRENVQELHVAARPVMNPGDEGEGCIYFDHWAEQVACWGFDDLIGYDGPPPKLLEEAERFFRNWMDQKVNSA